jgi:hypothetical protein
MLNISGTRGRGEGLDDPQQDADPWNSLPMNHQYDTYLVLSRNTSKIYLEIFKFNTTGQIGDHRTSPDNLMGYSIMLYPMVPLSSIPAHIDQKTNQLDTPTLLSPEFRHTQASPLDHCQQTSCLLHEMGQGSCLCYG